MTQPTACYPLLESKWREVLRYVLDDLGAAVVSHATYNDFGGKLCYDPVSAGIAECGTVTIDHLVRFARWAEAELSPEARRRFVVAHLGLVLPDRHDRMERFDEFMSAGLSSDISGNLEGLDRDACELRELLARYPGQIVFGTDLAVDGTAPCERAIRDAYLFAVTGDMGSTHTVDVCGKGPIAVQGMALDDPVVDGCGADVPAELQCKVLRDNFVSLFEGP